LKQRASAPRDKGGARKRLAGALNRRDLANREAYWWQVRAVEMQKKKPLNIRLRKLSKFRLVNVVKFFVP
jgi:hypothetical protein